MISKAPDGATEVGEKLNTWIHRGYHLPVPPSILLKLMELGRNAEASPADYAEVISAGSSLTGKVLAAVNSSWFGVRQPIRKTAQAVNLLGMVSVRMLAITHCMAAFHEKTRLPDDLVRQYWQAGLVKAESAKYLAEQVDESVADEAFLVGTMQDMVMPLMHYLCPDLYEEVVAGTPVDPEELCRRESEVFGMNHAQAAGTLGRAIGIPESVCDIIRNHHDINALRNTCGDTALSDAVHFASLFPHMCTEWSAPQAAAAAEMIERTFAPGILSTSIPRVIEEIERRYQHLSDRIEPAGAETVDLQALLAEATAEIATTATSLVGQVHSMMSNSTQFTSQLSAVNAEAIRLQEQTQVDGLTGVLNRAGLEKLGAEQLHRLQQTQESMMLAFVDLDDFKGTNDRFGHDKGDEALQWVAAALRDVYGPAAIVGRYGGDEFVVMSGQTPSMAEAAQTANRVLESLRPGLTDDDGTMIPVGLSIGGIWCEAAPPHAEFRSLLVGADEMMYTAKKKDADSVQFKQFGT